MNVLAVVVAYLCLFSFKIDFLPFADSSVRLDDFLLLIFFIVFLLTRSRVALPTPIRWLIVYFCVCILSALVNVTSSGINSLEALLFSARHLEYGLFFYVGYILHGAKFNWRKYLVTYLIFSIAVCLLVLMEIVPNPSRFHFDRFSANTTGPFEYAVVLSFIFLFFVNKADIWSIWSHRVFSVIALLLTYSRVTLVALAVSILSRKDGMGVLAGLGRYTAVFIVAAAVFLISLFFDVFLLSRFTGLLALDYASVFAEFSRNLIVVETQEQYFDLVYNDGRNTEISELEGDASLLIRLNKWIVLVSSTLTVSPLLGLGPSFASVGVDGFYVRLLAETGLIGLFVYLRMIASLFSSAERYESGLLSRFLIVLVLTGFFIDIFVSFKPMMLMWLLLGFSHKCFLEKVDRDKKAASLEFVARSAT